jgi:hypothetical protein
MKQTAQDYNSLRGPGLTVLVMDVVRLHHGTNTKVSTRQVAMQMGRSKQLTKDQLSTLYKRVRTVVRSLADAGLVHLTKDYDRQKCVNVTYISIPTNTTPPSCSE